MKMVRFIQILFFLGLALVNWAQNNAVVIDDNAYIVINGGVNGTEAVLVVDQPHQNGIITTGSGGNIITQGEFDYVKWNIGTSTGAYTVPFTADANNAKIPLTVNITGAGTGAGYIAFSSWDVSPAGFDNTPWPSQVTHMAGANGNPDVSDYVVDRFWVIDVNDPLGTGETYSAIPSPTINFTYNTGYAPEMGGGNLLTEGLLGGQHFDPVGENWHGSGAGVGTATGIWGADNASGLVSGVTPPAGEWYRTWTLSDYSSPLPVELTYFDLKCEEEGVVVFWETVSEVNASHFEIHKSSNGVDYELIGTVQAMGNSSNPVTYSYTDQYSSAANMAYRLTEVDNNGSRRVLSSSMVSGCVSDATFEAYGTLNGDVVITLNSSFKDDYDVMLFDALGKQVSASQNISVVKGFNQFELSYNHLAFGTYLLQVVNDRESFTKKITIR
ncbi:T9SS type A sorting domain-containing protein [Parvicella tangerina]|uniref:Secretion system C-terminal sorting domain-containing protein n=1 Tax=Parvicella tangerina TaxID=2829795 RepID=A0A916JPZ3_9FLAO|nr:T9SS type A sorting domain-containing protein [Parvicella tangerina]CAG5086169.1 hypothetical protein CRYO30217_03031 [Parvicella tangerina]